MHSSNHAPDFNPWAADIARLRVRFDSWPTQHLCSWSASHMTFSSSLPGKSFFTRKTLIVGSYMRDNRGGMSGTGDKNTQKSTTLLTH